MVVTFDEFAKICRELLDLSCDSPGLKKLQGAIIEGTLDARQVGQLAYTIQLAAWNVGRTSIMNRNES